MLKVCEYVCPGVEVGAIWQFMSFMKQKFPLAWVPVIDTTLFPDAAKVHLTVSPTLMSPKSGSNLKLPAAPTMTGTVLPPDCAMSSAELGMSGWPAMAMSPAGGLLVLPQPAATSRTRMGACLMV